jgi:ribosome-binding factor A
MHTESIRQRKIADQVKTLVSQIIDRKLKDPRKGFVTVTHVRMSGDLRIASIYYTVMGDEAQKAQTAQALNRARNFIRSELAPHLKLRFIPELRFFYDETLDYSEHIEQLIQKVKSQEKNPSPEESEET